MSVGGDKLAATFSSDAGDIAPAFQNSLRRAATFHQSCSATVTSLQHTKSNLVRSTAGSCGGDHRERNSSSMIDGAHELSDASNFESEDDTSEVVSPNVNNSLSPPRVHVGKGGLLSNMKPLTAWSANGERKKSLPPPGGRKEIKLIPGDDHDEDAVQEEMLEEVERAHVSKECNFSRMGLSVFPDQFLTTDFVALLTSLVLCENRLTSLPEEPFRHMPLLKVLDLANNHLESIPAAIFTLPKLQTLLCDHNDITSIPVEEGLELARRENCRFLPCITRLGLAWNDIKKFPIEIIQQCPLLTELYTVGNPDIFTLGVPSLQDFERCRRGGKEAALTIGADNRPKFTSIVERERWCSRLPWLRFEWEKIYPDKVLDFLYLGSLRTAQTVQVYQDLNIGFVLTAGRDLNVHLSPGMRHLEIAVDDLPGENMIPLFEQAFEFIDCAKAARSGILIHCFAGLSRSVTITAAYLMRTMYPMTRDEAMRLIRQSRPNAEPNKGFMENLRIYEDILRDAHANDESNLEATASSP